MRTTVVLAAMTMMATLALAEERPKQSSFEAKRTKAAIQMSLDQQASQRATYLNYVGTKILVSPDVKLPASVATTLAKADWKPTGRLAYYDWLNGVTNLRCNGWSGAITKAKAVPGGYVINVDFTPVLAGPDGGDTNALGVFHEIYEVSTRLHFKYVRGSGDAVPQMLHLD
ncbi:hypothetical protein [Singulisphaera acidiphila]|uniref:Uncharacterized protein n=1 Tax=Singulisphaera acidiphila (strain ATCC BAA-1392 / DSM 18658 / VKM B-2454 / MOB10) TaxID=886293 RepID=L0DM85_SINAD|nr:hypothetical protein [Singulisphaera acidiphila]AGA29953.1 hypothetical protein Sinac_5830 [Singulisphaera acidiphila DSM 18658]